MTPSPSAGTTGNQEAQAPSAKITPPTESGTTYNIHITGSTIGGLGVGTGVNVAGAANVSATASAAFATPHQMATDVDVGIGAGAKTKDLSLVVLGPHVIAEGERVAASGNMWTVHLYRFLLGDTSVLTHVADASGNVVASDRCIVLSDSGEARALAGDFSWRRKKGYIEAQVPVAPPSPKRSVNDLETIDIDTMEMVRGIAAGSTSLRTWLGTAIGQMSDGVGTWISEWLRVSSFALCSQIS